MVQERARSSQTAAAVNLPCLESGDHLTRHEFERRYHAMPDLKKAELIEGVVYVPSPLRFEPHAEPHGHLITWLGVYQAMTPGVRIGDNPTVRLDWDNEPQPDALLLIDPIAGGQTRLSPDGYIEGAPELVVEIAASSAAIDLGSKMQAYRRNGVLEYVVWQAFENRLSWFQLVEGEYQQLMPDAEGMIRSQVFPGLWLAVEALLSGDMKTVLSAVQAGLGSSDHETFVKQLRSR
ncbi:Uma2 family endonuclease [Romeria aff. gracilis LEGE 07310]|uniref:Uma2 family endonuclease n=1 Tax=Vasconcelosia minhoensis LEGE 07310 TaxID=915328 RepID=A0A8J7DM31_9CYAN|nr:Uma2 family endonuclease [Romeria gracilis]MBE9075845.1 Uma2 family endonuclease [Romeria aff. gracilis LEGE 07310]